MSEQLADVHMKELKDKINEYIPNKDKFYEWLLR